MESKLGIVFATQLQFDDIWNKAKPEERFNLEIPYRSIYLQADNTLVICTEPQGAYLRPVESLTEVLP